MISFQAQSTQLLKDLDEVPSTRDVEIDVNHTRPFKNGTSTLGRIACYK